MSSEAGHSIPISFRISASSVADDAGRTKVLDEFCKILEKYVGKLEKVSSVPLPRKDHLAVLTSAAGLLTVHTYHNGLVSAKFDYFTQDSQTQLFGVDEGLKIEETIKADMEATCVRVLPALKEGLEVNVYYNTSDNRILEYDVDQLLFQKKSDFQKVEIVHSPSFGNILVLDNLMNLGESDVSYTHGLMNQGVENYDDKTVLILGGGDGALLYELLKENPKHVLMIDIDEVVMEACRLHLRSVCGTVLDNYKAPNYEVIVGDAFVYLQKFIKEGRTFDYVFADLTDVPVSQEAVGDLWEFLGSVMSQGLKVLKPATGRYMTHAIGETATHALEMFEKKLWEQPVSTVSKTKRFVPSFLENWVFFQATKSAST